MEVLFGGGLFLVVFNSEAKLYESAYKEMKHQV